MRFGLIFALVGCPVKDAVLPGETADTAVPAPWTDADSDGYVEGDDCDDNDADIRPGADELCDGLDNDCDGETDEGVLEDWYADADGDGYGDPGSVSLACAEPDGSVGNALDCDDTSAEVNPGASEESHNGVDDDCDETYVAWSGDNKAENVGVAEIWGLDVGSGDYTDSPDYTGKFVLNPGDLTGDGVADLAITAPAADCTADQRDCGGVFVYAGPVTEDQTLDTASDAYLGTVGGLGGYGFAALGDIDGSGTPDLGFGNTAGRYWIVLTGGGTDGALSLGVELYDMAASSYFGLSSSGGQPYYEGSAGDLLIGAYVERGSYGGAFLYTGELLDLTYEDYSLHIMGDEGGAHLGQDVELMDLDTDGLAEVVLGAPEMNGAATHSGAVYILGSGESGTVSAADATVASIDVSGCLLGTSVANGGDLDGDGTEDLMLGGPGCGAESAAAVGYVVAMLGGVDALTHPTGVEYYAWFTGEKSYDYLGAGLGDAGDLDQDGVHEVLLGAYGRSETGISGLAALWYGPLEAGAHPAGAADATFYGSETGEAMGYSVAGGGDLTGDGWPDLVFGGPTARGVGVARVVSGNAY